MTFNALQYKCGSKKEKPAHNPQHTNAENNKRNNEPDILGVEKNGAQKNKNIQDDSRLASQKKLKTRVELDPIDEESNDVDSDIETEVAHRLDKDTYQQPAT